MAIAPGGPLHDKPVARSVFKGTAVLRPVRIERTNFLEPRREQAGTPFLPGFSLRDVEDQQILLGGSWLYGMATAEGEFKVKVFTSGAEHDSIESVVVLKAPDHFQPEALRVHGSSLDQIGDRTSNPKLLRHRERSFLFGLTIELRRDR